MTERSDMDMLAAEYALGTLDEHERADVATRRIREPEFDAVVTSWEQRLSPLLAHIGDVAPPPGLLARIQARLDDSAAPRQQPRTDGAVIALLQRRVVRWRAAAIAASALAACLVGAVLLRETIYVPDRQNVVGFFQKDDGRPSFLLTVDLKTREVIVRPVTAQRQPGKSYQLWIVSEKLGPAPRSLGLLDASLQPTRKQLSDYDADLLSRATFGISVEPEGGSPTGRPSTQALHSKLYPTSL